MLCAPRHPYRVVASMRSPILLSPLLLAAALVAGGCFKDMAPAGPIPDADASLGADVATSGAVYEGAPSVPFPVLPMRLWGLDFPEEMLWEFGEDPTYGMVEVARIARRDGTHTFFVLVSERGGRQHVGIGDPEDGKLAEAFPAPAYDAHLRVIRLESETHLSYDAAFHLPDGRLVQAHAESKREHPAPSARNGNAMNHSQEAVLAVLDLRQMGLSQTTVYVDDRWVPVRVLLPFVPYSMHLVQAVGGVAAGRLTLTSDGLQIGDGGPVLRFSMTRVGDELHYVGSDPIADHVYRFRATERGAEGPLELVGVSVRHGDVEVFSARFNPPLPDLRWTPTREMRSRMVAGAYGQDGYLVGEVRVTPGDGETLVDVLPERHRWACERPVRTRVSVFGGAIQLVATIEPSLAAGGVGAEGCAALDR